MDNSSTWAVKKTMQMSIESLYLGPAIDVPAILWESFPELGFVKEDLHEVSSIQAQAMVFLSDFHQSFC